MHVEAVGCVCSLLPQTHFLPCCLSWEADVSRLHPPGFLTWDRPMGGIISRSERRRRKRYSFPSSLLLPGFWQSSLVLFSTELPDQSRKG